MAKQTSAKWIELVTSPELETVSQAAADRFLALAHTRDPSTVALSGGSTPRRLYETLAASPFCEHIPWERVHVFWGDERSVPPDDPGSNHRLARCGRGLIWSCWAWGTMGTLRPFSLVRMPYTKRRSRWWV